MWDAATQVRSFPQMIDVIQESIGSGWSATFEKHIRRITAGYRTMDWIN